jgi:hypothetical protein
VLTATALAFIYLLSDYSWYLGLPKPGMTVAQGTAVYNASFIFCLAFSICLLGEQIDRWKVRCL